MKTRVKIRIYLMIMFCLLLASSGAFTPPCSELSDIPQQLDELVPVSIKDGKKELHVFRKYFISKRNSESDQQNPFSETVWSFSVEQDMLFRMRVQSPNVNFKISLTTSDGTVLADANSVLGYGASISSLLNKDKLSTNDVQIKFHFADFLKSPEEIIEHEDVHDCHLPHIVLELSIMSTEEFLARKKNYLEQLSSDVEDTFPDINDSGIGYHPPSYGNEVDEEVSLKMSDHENYYTLSKTDSDRQGKFQILKEYHISISSEEERKKNPDALPLLYYLQLQLTADFMTSGSMHVVVVHEKDEGDPLLQKENLFAYDSLNCAEDMLCVVSQRSAKNEESMGVAMTEGNYGIYFIDYQNEAIRNFIAGNVRKIQFSSVINLYPIESEDNSVYCDGLAVPNPYFVPYMIAGGHKFDQRIEVDLRNTTQDLYFDLDTGGDTESLLVRVTTEQDIGMDVDITIFDSNQGQIARGKDIGATETVVFKAARSGRYKVQLSFRNSIIRDLMSCPQIHLYVSSLTETKARDIGKKQQELLSSNESVYTKIESVFSSIQTAINEGSGYSNFDDSDYVYVLSRESFSNIEESIYTNKLSISKRPYWIYIEIFCDQVINDVVVNMEYEEKRFSKTTSVEEKLNAGKTDELLRSQKAIHVFSMVMSYNDNYEIKFLSRNLMDSISGFDDQFKHVMFQMRVMVQPLNKEKSLTMTSLLPKTFNNLRDLGLYGIKNEEMRYFRERIQLSTKERNVIDFSVEKPSQFRMMLKSLFSDVSIKRVYLKDSYGTEIDGTVIEKTFDDIDVSYTLKNSGTYTLYVAVGAKQGKYGEFFWRMELEPIPSRKQCASEKLPDFEQIAIKSKRSEVTQETHYFIGNSMFRNVYHLGQRQIGTPTDFFKINLPTSDGKSYYTLPFTLKKKSNLISVNLFHDWAADLVKVYILEEKENPQDLYEVIRNQKKLGLNENVQEIDSILQSSALEYFEGIEKQPISSGNYKLVIMHMDIGSETASTGCLNFAMSIFIEEELAKTDSRVDTGLIVSSDNDVTDSMDEAIIESITLCQYSFIFPEIFTTPLKINGGVLSIDSIYRFDNDERWKKIELNLDTNSVIYVKITDIYNQMSELDISILVVKDEPDKPLGESVQVIANKRADKDSKSASEKFAEIQKFVKKGKYLVDLGKSVFDLDTSLFPCNRIRFEVEIRPLSDIPSILMSDEACPDDQQTKSRLPVVAESTYNKMIRYDEYFPITSSVMKKFKFKITEPTFLSFLATFEKELSGGSMSLSISHISDSSSGANNDIAGLLPVYYSTETADGITFLHERLEPGLAGDVKLDSTGEYVITISGGHKAVLTKTLETNKFIPHCSKVSMFYQMTKISDIKNTYDEEFISEGGTVDASGNNCKNVKIDDLLSVQRYIESQRDSDYMDVSSNILIPDPTTKKSLQLALRTLNKPTTSVVRVTASLPDDVSLISNTKYNMRVVQINDKEKTDFIMHKTLKPHEKDISFTIDDTDAKNYVVLIEFEDVDFNILQSHCSYIQIRVAREPLFNVAALLAQFETGKGYVDIDTWKNSPDSIVIDKEKRVKYGFYQTPNSLETSKGRILAKIEIDVQLEQAQLDIFVEHNYISSAITLELTGSQQFRDLSVYEVEDRHYDGNQFYTARSSIRLIGSGDVLPKGKYTLLIKRGDYSKKILQEFRDAEFQDKLLNDIKFPFTIRIESEPVNEDLSTQSESLRLIDIEYNDDPDDDAKSINPERDLLVTLEFNDDLDNTGISNEKIALLKLDKSYHRGVKKEQQSIGPTSIEKLSTDQITSTSHSTRSQNSLQLIFSSKTLRKGAKYTLELDSRIGINQDIIDKDELSVITQSYSCNPKGVNRSKAKLNGVCNCRYPYMGDTCSECQDEYVFNSNTQECVLFESCDGDTCSGHGQCSVNQKTGAAECACDPGFIDSEDGTSCSRCVDEDQVYPDCSDTKGKSGILASACQGLGARLVPSYMKDSGSLWKEKVGDVREFSRKYAVYTGTSTETLDLPVIDEATMVKIFFKTSSGLSAKVKILDSNENVELESTKPYKISTTSSILNPETVPDGSNVDNKSTVIIEYFYNETQVQEYDSKNIKMCWSMEILVSMVPYSEFLENSRCENVDKLDFTSDLTKKSSNFYDIYEFELSSEPKSVNEEVVIENQKIKIQLKPGMASINDGAVGRLMVGIYYDMQFLTLTSKLMKNNGAVQKFIKYGSTDLFEQELHTETQLSQISNTIITDLDKNFFSESDSYLEAEFSLGDRFLSMFEYGGNSNSDLCFTANIVVEYIPPKVPSSIEDSEDESIITYVKPATLKDIPVQQYHNITIEVGLEKSLLDAYPGIDPQSSLTGTMVSQMCVLENGDGSEFIFFDPAWTSIFSKADTIFPAQYSMPDTYDSIEYRFPTSQAYENSCYKLLCRINPTVVSSEYYDVKETAKVVTSYCFGDEVTGKSIASKACDSCNPLGSKRCGSKGQCVCAHPYTGDKCDQCKEGFSILTMPDGLHKCVKSTDKCSPDFCNFKGSCELKPNAKGVNVPTCSCQDMYAGKTCNLCKDKTMQFPGCHTATRKSLQDEIISKADDSIEQCQDIIPPILDTYEQVKYNGEAQLSGVFSLSEKNNKIKLLLDGGNKRKSLDCLLGSSGCNKLKVYVEYLEESYINKRIPLTVNKIKKDKKSIVKESVPIQVPGLDQSSPVLRGEYLETTLERTDDDAYQLHTLEFDVTDVMKNGLSFVKNGCLQVYLELTFGCGQNDASTIDQCNQDHSNILPGQLFSSNEVLRVSSGYDYTSIIDSVSNTFNSKSYAYTEGDGEFFHQKDIELSDSKVQVLDFKLLQNFATSQHILGLILEIPLDGNLDTFMHGESTPDCRNNECIYGDKIYDGSSINYVFNSNNISRIRLWFYRITPSTSTSSCTPYHFSLKSTPNYKDISAKEKVACQDESFPTQLTVRKYAHNDMEGAYIINDYFRVDSFIPDAEGSLQKSTLNLQKPSLLKLIIQKQIHVFAYQVAIFEIGGPSDTLKYATNNIVKNAKDAEATDIRVSILLPVGRYSIKIRALLNGNRSIYKTCESILVYMGVMPQSEIKDYNAQLATTNLPELANLLKSGNSTIIKLLSESSIPARNSGEKYVNDFEFMQSTPIRYSGSSGNLGFYLEIIENNDPNHFVDIAEITASLFPDVKIVGDKNSSSFSKFDIPLVSTSSGKTYVYIKQLKPDTTYRIDILRQKLLSLSDNTDTSIFSRAKIRAFFYSADKNADLKKAKVEIASNEVVVPVQPWQPACQETVLSPSLLKDAVSDVIASGVQYTEILALNEDITRLATPFIDLSGMKDSEATLIVTASPYDTDGENPLDEFMISSATQGSEKTNARSQQFEGGIYLAQISLSKSKHTALALRINYAMDSFEVNNFDSSCNLIRLNIEYIPKLKTAEEKICSSSNAFDTTIKSLLPSILPDPNLGQALDQSINYEYSTVNTQDPKFKLDPYKPEQNKVKFTLKKASNFRFEMNWFACTPSPIVRNVMLKSTTKTHNKIVRSTVALGVPSIGNSLLLYVDELLPGNYEVEIQYGWLTDFDTSFYKNINEVVDFQIEIYSLHQDVSTAEILHNKDRHIRDLETVVRDYSVVAFMGKKKAQYYGEELYIPLHPTNPGSPLSIPFKIIPENAQVLLNVQKKFRYIDSIEILYKQSNSMVKRIFSDTDPFISEILHPGEYLLNFNYKDDDRAYNTTVPQTINFGISDYENVKLYKTCNGVFVNKCADAKLSETAVMLKPNNGLVNMNFEAMSQEMVNLQLHYNPFLTKTPLKVFLDKRNRAVSKDYMSHMVLSKGNHTLVIKGPESSLDGTCILASVVKYETPVAETQISQMPGIEMKPGIQSVLVSGLQKGTTNLPLPSLKDNSDDAIFATTLLLDFDESSVKLKTPNYVELDLNFDSKLSFDYQPQMHYETTKDKIISYFDIDGKEGADVDKQIEVIHTKDFKNGEYTAHLAIFNGNQLESKFDQCREELTDTKILLLDQTADFLYTDYGKEDFGLALLPDVLKGDSKFFDAENNLFFMEIVYQIQSPSFIEMVVEFDYALQNVELYVFQDFNDQETFEDQELADSSLDVPSYLESKATRHTSIYLTKPGKYSIFVIDKKLPKVMSLMSEFSDESPCAVLKISHSIQKVSTEKLVDSSLLFLSVWPRRIEINSPFFVNVNRNLMVSIYPNSMLLDPRKPPSIKFAVISIETGKKMYNLEPDHTVVTYPTRSLPSKDGLEKYVKEVKISCFFKASTLKDVVGQQKLLTLEDRDMVSDISLLPYYMTVDTNAKDMKDIDTGERKAIITPEAGKSNQKVKEKLTLKQRRHKLTTTLDVIQECQKNCVHGDCNDSGTCVCRKGYVGSKCETKKQRGQVDKLKEKQLEKAKQAKSASDEIDFDDEFDYDTEDTIETIQPTKVYGSSKSTTLESNTKDGEQVSTSYGWFDLFLLLLLVFGVSIIFYQKLWDGRFCRKKFRNKFYDKKRDDEDPDDQEDKAIITEELELISRGGTDMPKMRRKHDE